MTAEIIPFPLAGSAARRSRSHVSQTVWTFGSYFRRQYLPDVLADPIDPRSDETVTAWAETIDHVARRIGDLPISTYTEDHYRQLIASLRAEGLSGLTIHRHARQFRSILQYAADHGYRQPIPVGSPRWRLPPKPDKTTVASTTVRELRALLLAAADIQSPRAFRDPPVSWRAVLILIAYTGLSRSEIFGKRRRRGAERTGGLRWSDIVRMDDGSTWVETYRSKTSHARTRFLHPVAAAWLDRVPRTGEWIWPTLCLDALGERLLHLAELGRRRVQSMPSDQCEALRIAPPADRRWHQIRAYHASWTASGGSDWTRRVDQARAQLGHSSATTTVRHYLAPGVIEAAERATAEQLPDLTEGLPLD